MWSSPEPVDTELWVEQRDAARDSITKTAHLGKMGLPEEVAEAYIYLMKDTNAAGSMVITNGGGLMQ